VRVDIATGFRPVVRRELDSGALQIPRCSIYVDRQLA
jgi:hypothetical protein